MYDETETLSSKSEKDDRQEYKRRAVDPALSFPPMAAMRKMTHTLEGLLESSDDPSMIGLSLEDNMEIQQKRPPTTIINGDIINAGCEE